MNEKNGAIRDASVLGVPKMLILGLHGSLTVEYQEKYLQVL